MFDLPDAKRVRREELLFGTSLSPPSSPPPQDSIEDGYARLGKLLNLDEDAFITPSAPSTTQNETPTEKTATQNDVEEEEEQEFEFRLFSAPVPRKEAAGDSEKKINKDADNTVAEVQTQKLRIRLRSPTPAPADAGEGRFVNPSRGWEYYFSTPTLISKDRTIGTTFHSTAWGGAIDEKRREFEAVAVDGGMVLKWASQDWPGCHLPWRIIQLKRQDTKIPSKDVYMVDQPGRTTSPKTRKKPGKKRRIQLRKKVAAANAAKETEAEKRNRKNREKKIKRRQKAREMKAAAAAQGLSVVSTGDGDDVSSQGEEN